MATATDTTPATDTWTKQLDQLKARYKHVRPPIVAALNILLHDQNISDEDAKARAKLHGVRITAASIAAAKRLLERADAKPVEVIERQADGFTAVVRPARRARAANTGADVEALVRGVVEKVRLQGNVEAERLRDGIRKAITALQATLGA